MGNFLQTTAFVTTCLFNICGLSFCQKWHEEKNHHKSSKLDSQTYQTLITGGGVVNFEGILSPLLITRVPGTENHAAVNKYITDFMVNLGWNIEKDSFKDTTPFGPKLFENIITTLNPTVQRRLILACHYDTAEYTFIGATDSTVPCAQLLHLAATMKPMLDQHKNTPQNVTLQFIFFDGEEAFNSWTATDSLYGSRHLAAKWEAETYPLENTENTTTLNRMDMMILLDLIGTNDTEIYDYFKETALWYDTMAQIEQELKTSNHWNGTNKHHIFKGQANWRGPEDDHIPFLQRGVNILHLIATPFPHVWHTEKDTKEALDFESIENLNKIFRLFIAKYLHLSSVSV